MTRVNPVGCCWDANDAAVPVKLPEFVDSTKLSPQSLNNNKKAVGGMLMFPVSNTPSQTAAAAKSC